MKKTLRRNTINDCAGDKRIPRKEHGFQDQISDEHDLKWWGGRVKLQDKKVLWYWLSCDGMWQDYGFHLDHLHDNIMMLTRQHHPPYNSVNLFLFATSCNDFTRAVTRDRVSAMCRHPGLPIYHELFRNLGWTTLVRWYAVVWRRCERESGNDPLDCFCLVCRTRELVGLLHTSSFSGECVQHASFLRLLTLLVHWPHTSGHRVAQSTSPLTTTAHTSLPTILETKVIAEQGSVPRVTLNEKSRRYDLSLDRTISEVGDVMQPARPHGAPCSGEHRTCFCSVFRLRPFFYFSKSNLRSFGKWVLSHQAHWIADVQRLKFQVRGNLGRNWEILRGHLRNAPDKQFRSMDLWHQWLVLMRNVKKKPKVQDKCTGDLVISLPVANRKYVAGLAIVVGGLTTQSVLCWLRNRGWSERDSKYRDIREWRTEKGNGPTKRKERENGSKKKESSRTKGGCQMKKPLEMNVLMRDSGVWNNLATRDNALIGLANRREMTRPSSLPSRIRDR